MCQKIATTRKAEIMGNSTQKAIPFFSIVLYVLSGLLLIYTVWAVRQSIGYITDMIRQGQLSPEGNEYNIINFYMSSCSQYAIFSVILFSLGRLLQKLSAVCPGVGTTSAQYKSSEMRDSFDNDDFEDNVDNYIENIDEDLEG
jgi:hypothetical protein